MLKNKIGIFVKILTFIIVTFSFLVALEAKECEKKSDKVQRLIITNVVPGGSGEIAGMKPGDAIVSYNGKEVCCTKKLGMLKDEVVTDSVEVVINRDENIISFTIPKGIIGIYLKELLPDIEFEKDAVTIEGIGRLDWRTGESSSFIAALTRIAEYLGIQKDYTYLMGTSGAVFRIQFYEDWCPSAPDATVGFDCGAASVKSLNLNQESIFDKESENKEKMQQKIMASIDKNMPVIAIDLIEMPEWGLIIGYQKKGEELIVRTYFDRREGYDIAEKFPWAVIIVNQEKGNIDDNGNFVQSLKIAQDLYETEKYKAYYSGTAAIEYWIKKLKEDKFESFDDEKFNDIMLTNAWIFERLADDRMVGAEYLKSFATQFAQGEDDIIKLASIYETENKLMTSAEKIAPYPFQVEKRDDWTDEMRNTEIEILTKVLEKEKEAYLVIKEINKKIQD
jgi:hypothetical protein